LNYRNEDTCYILGGGILAEGYYDEATPYYASQYTLAHLFIDPTVAKNNVQVERYPAGHMMYIDEPSAKKLRSDLTRFYDFAVRGQAVP
jgi:carboxypeptidase C (cathepsin A)